MCESEEVVIMKEELNKLIRAVILCIEFCIFIALFVALLLRTPFLAGQKAFLYRLLALDILSCFVLLVVCIPICIKKGTVLGQSLSSLIRCIGLSTLFMALFLSLGPMPIERSYTIFSLADMSENPDMIYTSEEIKEQFIEGYIEDAGESQKRIDEQVYIGNLEEIEDGYRITTKGKQLISLFRFIEYIFPVPDENSIYPNGK